MPTNDARLAFDALRRRVDDTSSRIRGVRDAVEPFATRRGEQPAPGWVVAEARTVLAAAARLLSREPGWRTHLALHGAPSWAELAARLGFAARGLRTFETSYIEPFVDAFEDEDDLDDAALADAPLATQSRALAALVKSLER